MTLSDLEMRDGMERTGTQQERTEPVPRFCNRTEPDMKKYVQKNKIYKKHIKYVQKPELNRTLPLKEPNRPSTQTSWFLLGFFR